MSQSLVTKLPPGRHGLTAEQVAASQRQRMLAAMLDVVGQKGYPAATVGDVTRLAHVSRGAFYAQFENKEACFLAAYQDVTSEFMDELRAVGLSQPTYVEGMRDGMRAYLAFWASRPLLARAWFLEIQAAGPAGRERRDEAMRAMEQLFGAVAARARREDPSLERLPRFVGRGIASASLDLTGDAIRREERDLTELEEPLLYLWLMALANHAVAQAALA